MVYFFLEESDVGDIDLILNFESSYLILGNVLPIMLISKIRQVYSEIERDSPGINVIFGTKDNTNYHMIYNCQTIFIVISVLRFIIYIVLVVLFLIQF